MTERFAGGNGHTAAMLFNLDGTFADTTPEENPAHRSANGMIREPPDVPRWLDRENS